MKHNSTPSTASAAWTMTTEDLLTQLHTTPKGLTTVEWHKRLLVSGPNEISENTGRSPARIFIDQFASPLTLILIGASLISFALGEHTETIIIILMIVLSGVLSFVQEFRSEHALALLRKKLTRKANVYRNGTIHRVDARELVVGDVVELELGTVIPADLRLIQVQDLEIDEGTLTGESSPVVKITDAIAKSRSTPQRQSNMAFLGTHVVQGGGMGVVVSTGRQTEMGKTAALLNIKPDETEFQHGVRDFGSMLLKITIALAIIVAGLLGILRGQWGESILFALALAVGLSPELLPVIVTLNLSRGALVMSKKHVLVKRLISIEDLGNADVFCTDKTGTLTVGALRVRDSVDPDGKSSPEVLALASHCIEIDAKGKATSPVDEAILDAMKLGETSKALPKSSLIDLISFDFLRRRMSCVLESAHGMRWLIVKGAMQETLAACTTRVSKNGQLSTHLRAEDRKALLERAETYHTQGVRLIAVARRQIGEQKTYSPADEKGLELIGFILVSDAPKETAKAALASLKDLNVRIVILTGDDPEVTRYVASQLKFSITGIKTGDEIEKMDDLQLTHAVETNNVFARITPTHKLRILKALKTAGHRVGFMGDGVNDAPALHAADVGISFESAVDVAKEAAGVILLQKNLGVLADGIREGRRTFVKTRNYINITISSNFGNMLSVAGSALLLPFIPLLPAQILLLNLLTDFPMLAISTDRVPEEEIAFPKKWDIHQISNYMYFFGAISSLADYATFGILLFLAHADVAVFRSGWFIESTITEIVIVFLLRTRRISLANIPGRALMSASVLAVAIAFAIVETGIGAQFGLTPLTGQLIGIILLVILGYAILVEIGKASYYRFWEKVGGKGGQTVDSRR